MVAGSTVEHVAAGGRRYPGHAVIATGHVPAYTVAVIYVFS